MVKFMVSKRNITMFTMRNETTGPTNLVGGISPSVLEKDDLFFLCQGLVHGLFQCRRDHVTDHFIIDHSSGIGHCNRRKFHATIAFKHFHQPIFSTYRLGIGFDAGRCTPQDHFCIGHPCIIERCITGIVARCRILLLEGCILLFINDDE